MEKRTFKDKEISLLGFGLMRLPRLAPPGEGMDEALATQLVDYAIAHGVNYFDTAILYRGSEDFAGRALSRYPRDSYYLASKCPGFMAGTPEDFDKAFADSLARCQTDYFDFFLVHNVAQDPKVPSANEAYFQQFKKQGMYAMCKQKQAEGKIRHVGFSFHGSPELLKMLTDEYDWDFVQIQLNYMDWTGTNAKAQYEILTERGIPVVVMEPLRGGALATLTEESGKILKDADPKASLASWGIRYAASLPNVITVLSGMNAMDQMTDNLATLDSLRPVTEQEKELLEKAASLYNQSGAIACTGCAYCMPCPHGANIPRIFSIYNHYQLTKFRIGFDNSYGSLEENENASACIQCGECVEKCPQHLTIPDYMKEIDDFAKEPPRR